MGVATQGQTDSLAAFRIMMCRRGLPLAIVGAMAIAPSASTTIRPLEPGYVRIFDGDSATYPHAAASLRDRGWAFAQRVSDAAKQVTAPDFVTDDDELVEPPDPSTWENLPATRWA
jgi:hypothetical protein